MSGGGGVRRHAESPPRRPVPGPKLQVQRSLSRDTITIHFSALGKEDDDEEGELYGPSGPHPDGAGGLRAFGPKAQPFLEWESATGNAHATVVAAGVAPPAGSCSPCKSAGPPSSRPFLSLVRSLSTEVEAREAAPPRHRHLMKSLVKSLSTDASKGGEQEGPGQQALHPASPQQQAQTSQRPPPRNVQLFKQFSQPRLSSAPAVAPQVGGDSKTAPSSPTAPPDGRSFFKVQEVEAKIEDTRRRLSEVMSDPLQLFSKIMGEESGPGGPQRARLLSSSASELSGAPALNGHPESSGFSIKEEEGAEGEEDQQTPAGGGPHCVSFSFPSSAVAPARSPSLTLGRCSMSALAARQDDGDLCPLYGRGFDWRADTETPDGDGPGFGASESSGPPPRGGANPEAEDEERAATVPWRGLLCLTQLLYCYLVLPLPPYVCAAARGLLAGFALAVLALWLSAPRRSRSGSGAARRGMKPCNAARLDMEEPGVFKGWMNEIHSYDPETYHATLTHSVLVRLEGSVLRLSKPNRNISRRAARDEPKADVTYVGQKIYELSDGKVYLMPPNLARKRVWNKKYPVCIELAKQDDFTSEAQRDEGDEDGENAEPAEGGGPERAKAAPAGGRLTIYLFGRTGREKEEWFRRFLLASRIKSDGPGGAAPKSAGQPSRGHQEAEGASGGADEPDQPQPQPLPQPQPQPRPQQKSLLDYNVYMAKYVKAQPAPASPPPAHSPQRSPQTSKKTPRSSEEPFEPEAWVNAFLGRIFWDFLGEKYWADVVSKKIQMKLSKIRLPYVMNELTLTELDMGFSIPQILGASKPSVDHQGLWFDLEVSYAGSFLMTLETKMNLARLGKEAEGLGEHGKEWPPRAYCLADSDEESSSAGSSDEEDPAELFADRAPLPGGEGLVGGHRPSKIMRFVDKIAKSKYFQKATETEFIKKKMEEVANTPLLLTVEVQECRGTLAVNVPPPPTDRIWYGFRSPPHLELKARPKLGEREVTLVHVTDWIEKKLEQEFQKIFVMPNMDDLWLPIMHSAMDARSNAGLSSESNDASRDPPAQDSELSYV